MAGDRDIVKQLQRRVSSWQPSGKCKFGHDEQCCVYSKQERLIRLHLCGLQLAQVPSEVWQLSSLRYLYLIDNQLPSLPTEVSQLSSLKYLFLDKNRLDSLPGGIGRLSSLQLLTLGNNRLDSIPAELGQLSSLKHLYLDGNQLVSLPAELGQLSSLTRLELIGNPLQSPPPDIIKQGVPAILTYLRAQQAALPVAKEKPVKFQVPPAVVPAEKSTTIVQKARSIKIFYCYAHEDRDLRDRIDKHLGVLKRLGQVTGWYDREIQAGTEWEREIEAHLSTASIILLLVSADFVNSDYCYGVEMQKALDMHEKGKACVLPILLRPVDWQDAPFAKLQLLPTGAKPITRWSDPEEALEDVARQIRAVVTTLRTHGG